VTEQGITGDWLRVDKRWEGSHVLAFFQLHVYVMPVMCGLVITKGCTPNRSTTGVHSTLVHSTVVRSFFSGPQTV
jgi:hypothetical protein